jgi:hypothetical protein
MKKLVHFTVLSIGVLLALSIIDYEPSESGTSGTGNKTENTSTSEEVVRQDSCATSWRNCADNADLINNFEGMTEIRTACKLAIDEAATYGEPDWGGWLTVPFGKFCEGNDYVENGIVRLIDDEVKLQNGFGAMANATVHCHYDLTKGEVVRTYSE